MLYSNFPNLNITTNHVDPSRRESMKIVLRPLIGFSMQWNEKKDIRLSVKFSIIGHTFILKPINFQIF